MGRINCSFCGKEYSKDNRHINENRKLEYKFYCSVNCQSSFKNKRINLLCENLNCGKEFIKKASEFTSHNYCSRSCAVSVNNKRFPKRIAAIIKCIYCGIQMFHRRKYCSIECKSNNLTISKEEVIKRIKKFYRNNRRVPVKREMGGIYKPARKYFSTWNKAIEAAGFKANPVLFANNCVAKDGHVCNSIAEMTIDDYLFERSIEHERNTNYPEGKYTADFKIGNKIIEYFGLSGEHNRYDQLKKIKQGIVKKYSLKLIEIYPKDLYPQNKLADLL